MGSKAKIAKYIVPIIQRKIDESGARYYVEPFAGGCNVIDKIKAEYRIASDSNKYLIALFQHLQDGGELPNISHAKNITKRARHTEPEITACRRGTLARLVSLHRITADFTTAVMRDMEKTKVG